MVWLLLALWLIGLGVVVWRRSLRSDGRSVEEFQHTLERLAPRDRPLPSTDTSTDWAKGVSSRSHEGPAQPASLGPMVPLSGGRPSRGRFRLLAAGLAVALAIGAAAVWLGNAGEDQTTAAPATTDEPAPTTTPTETTAPEADPALAPVQLVVAEGDTRRYSVGRDGFTLSLAALDRCWVEVRSGATGPSLFEGTLDPGQRHDLEVEGVVHLRVGNPPGVEISIDGAVLDDLPGESIPVNVELLA
jgi:hypothetical protein